MLRKLVILLALAAVAAFSAQTYTVTFFQPSVVKGTELKAGDYKIQVTDQKVVLFNGKQPIELPAKVETSDTKFSSTTVRYTNQGGTSEIGEIRLGGSKTKLVFNQ